MVRRSGRGRAGATLIEMLVVISIIVVLISLLLPAAGKVRDAGDRAENRARMLAVNTALNTLKGNSAFGNPKYIPAGRPIFNNNGTITAGPYRLRSAYPASDNGSNDTNTNGDVNINSFEARHLIATFNIPIDGTGGLSGLTGAGGPTINADLDANQTLTFFLGGLPEADANGTAAQFPGFHPNPSTPFAARVAGTDPRKSTGLDLGGGGKPKYVLARPTPNGPYFAQMLDPYGTPYAYFVAFNGQANKYFGHNAAPVFGGVQAYQVGGTTPNTFENPSGYQLISAGKDKTFGASGNSKTIPRVGEDDVTNFLEKQLGSQQ